MCRISVIIPFYNVEAYIEETLRSICSQTFRDIEILCIDDGSPDGSSDIVRRFAQEDPRIRIFTQKNGGLSSARNHGIREARGKYLYFIDSDDRLKEQALEILWTEAEKDGLDILYFDAESFFETPELADSKTGEHYRSFYIRPDLYNEAVTGPELFTRMEKNDHFRASACLQMLRRSLLEERQVRFQEGILHEDELFSLQTLFAARAVKHLAVPLYERRIREGSIMTDVKNAWDRSRSDAILVKKMGEYLDHIYRYGNVWESPDQDAVPCPAECAALLDARARKMQMRGVKQAELLAPAELEERMETMNPEERMAYRFLIYSLVKDRAQAKKKWKKQSRELKNSLEEKDRKIGEMEALMAAKEEQIRMLSEKNRPLLGKLFKRNGEGKE